MCLEMCMITFSIKKKTSYKVRREQSRRQTGTAFLVAEGKGSVIFLCFPITA